MATGNTESNVGRDKGSTRHSRKPCPMSHVREKIQLTFQDLHIETVAAPGCEATKAQQAHFDWQLANLVNRHGQVAKRKLLARVVAQSDCEDRNKPLARVCHG